MDKKIVIQGFNETFVTKKCMDKEGLDQRFKMCDKQKLYVSCQPIYGFRKRADSRGQIQWYIINYRIMKILSGLDFNSLLEVGSAEGYTSYLAKKRFGVKTVCSDLSEEACKRGSEIFDMCSVCVDVCRLPFKDNAFDVVLCSETLEHVYDLPKAVNELLRIAKKAVVITVPHELKELISRNRKGEGLGSSHIHSFNLKSFDFLPYEIIVDNV